ncbi:hypothetical protein FZEAL_6296, partial [Fusarium zealandicum]
MTIAAAPRRLLLEHLYGSSSRIYLGCPPLKLSRPRSRAPTTRPCAFSTTTPGAARSGPEKTDEQSDTLMTTAERSAIRAAERREATLQAGRRRRAEEQEQRALDKQREEEDRKEYEKRYKNATRKWVRSIIAMPILLVTSYYLFDRLVLKNDPMLLPLEEEEKGEEEGKDEGEGGEANR